MHTETNGLELLCASDAVSSRIEAAQATVGQGPAVDSITVGGPELIANLAANGFTRWPAFIDAIGDNAATAMFSFPLQVGVIRLGALDLYRDTPHRLTQDEVNSMTLVAQATTMTLLHGPWWDQTTLSHTIHQATGMVVAQLGVPAREAYLRLQGYAFANGMVLSEVADDVVARRLRLED